MKKGSWEISYFSYQIGFCNGSGEQVEILAMTGLYAVSTMRSSERWYEISGCGCAPGVGASASDEEIGIVTEP